MEISKKELAKQVRRLRVHLSPVLTDHFKNVLHEAERQLTMGAVSKVPGKTHRATRVTKKDRVNKYL